MNNIGIKTYVLQKGDTLWEIAQRFLTTIYAIAAMNPGIDVNALRVGQTIHIWPGFGKYPIDSVLRGYASGISEEQLKLSNSLRQLWQEHVMWTREVIHSIILDLPNAKQAATRLLQNPEGFESLFKQYYGIEEAIKLRTLFRDHLLIAADLVTAAKQGNTQKTKEAEIKWYANADDLATYFASVNPYWTFDQWRKMLYDHLSLTEKEATDLLSKDYATEISDFDLIEKEAMMMADEMMDGIVQQFHTQFI